jgi:hypothetical protein
MCIKTKLLLLLIGVSIFFLIHLVNLPPSQLDLTSKIRFLCFIGVHGVIFICTVVTANLDDLYHKVVVNFIACLTIVSGIATCECLIKHIETDPFYNYKKNDGPFEEWELTYLNLYFIAYIVSILCLIGTAIFLIAT